MRRTHLLYGLLALATGCVGQAFTSEPDADAPEDEAGASDATVRDWPDSETGSTVDATDEGAVDAGEKPGKDAGAVHTLDASVHSPTDATMADAGSGVPDSSTDATPDAGAVDGRTQDAPVEDEACAAPITWYLDGDDDGYGGTTTSTACAAPQAPLGGGVWVTRDGDCDDSNAQVNPGVTAFFTVGYTPVGSTAVSFDYNCDHVETEARDSPEASCGWSGLICDGSGYIEATPLRSGAGVDPYCGSNQVVTCSFSLPFTCSGDEPFTANATIACH